MASMVWGQVALCLEVMRIKFMNMLAYRVVYFLGVFTYTINIGVYYFLWGAIYSQRETLGGLNFDQMITYVAVAWITRTFYFNNLDREIAREVREGKVAIELIRPYNYLFVKTAQSFGESFFRFFFFTLPGALFVYWVFPVSLPSSMTAAGWFFLSLLFSFWVNTQVNLITGLLAFFTLNATGITRFKRVVVDLFSGLILPVTFFPGWAQSLISALPFQAISYVPTMIYNGGLQGNHIHQALLQQVFWSTALTLAAHGLFALARKKMVIQGG